MGQPRIPDIDSSKVFTNGAGTGLTPLRDYWVRQMRINDEVQFVNRLTWYNIPPEIDGKDVERVIYYRKRGAFFYLSPLKKWAFLPYVTEGAVDYMGRFEYFRPLPFTGADEGRNDKDKMKNIVLSEIKRKPAYSVADIPEGISPEEFQETYCVPVEDYVNQYSRVGLSRSELSEGIIGMEANIPCFINTLLATNCGVRGVRVAGDDEVACVDQASDTIIYNALNGKKFVGIASPMEFQELTDGSGTVNAEEYLLAWESIDNIRIGALGLGNGGIFEKKNSVRNAELGANNYNTSLILEDALSERNRACLILGTGIFGSNPMITPDFYPRVEITVPSGLGMMNMAQTIGNAPETGNNNASNDKSSNESEGGENE